MHTIELIERELRVRGTTFETWAMRHGLTAKGAVQVLASNEEIVADLAETLGVTIAALSTLGDPRTIPEWYSN